MSSIEVYLTLRKSSDYPPPTHSPPSSKFCQVQLEAVVRSARKTNRRNLFRPVDVLGKGQHREVIVDFREFVVRMAFNVVNLKEY